MRLLLLLFLPCVSLGRESTVIVSDDYQYQNFSNHEKCVRITIDVCRDMPYKEAIYPNSLGHQSQQDAIDDIAQYASLVQIQCSADFKFFLCSLYAPFCNSLGTPILPCKYLCESAQSGCESLMRKFGYPWPAPFDCGKFPSDDLCVGENRSTDIKNDREQVDAVAPVRCPQNMQVLRSNAKYSLRITNTTLEDCSIPCNPTDDGELFSNTRTRRAVRFWTGAWAVTCFVSALFTVLTFAIDMPRFPYPVRPIFYLAVCYVFVSLVFMVGLVAENKVSCAARTAAHGPVASQGMESFPCAVLGVLHYYFSIASSFWWIVLCVAWFLAANLKWAQESIEGLSSYFHFFAWGFPALLCIMVLISNSIDGDVFTGICSVGNLKSSALLNFVFLPLCLCLALGLLFLCCGIMSMVRIRKYIKIKHSNIDQNIRKLEKLMMRISAFAVMYTLPTTLSTACIGYEALTRETWLAKWLLCPNRHTETFDPRACAGLQDVQTPELNFYLIKYLFQLFVGIACAVWVCSRKTLESFSKAYGRIVYGRSRVPTQVH